MTVANLIDAARRLSPPERAELLDALITMDESAGEDPGLTAAQRADLDRRIDDLEAGRARLIPGDEAFAQLRERR